MLLYISTFRCQNYPQEKGEWCTFLPSQLLCKDITSSLNFPFTTKDWSVGINQTSMVCTTLIKKKIVMFIKQNILL